MITLEEKVLKGIEVSRPYLQIDGGDVELVTIDAENGIVEVRYQGACKTCPMKLMTLRAGIERAIMLEAPEIKRIEEVA
jgi:Fe-S cluster biogenesis protein NfuA